MCGMRGTSQHGASSVSTWARSTEQRGLSQWYGIAATLGSPHGSARSSGRQTTIAAGACGVRGGGPRIDPGRGYASNLGAGTGDSGSRASRQDAQDPYANAARDHGTDTVAGHGRKAGPGSAGMAGTTTELCTAADERARACERTASGTDGSHASDRRHDARSPGKSTDYRFISGDGQRDTANSADALSFTRFRDHRRRLFTPIGGAITFEPTGRDASLARVYSPASRRPTQHWGTLAAGRGRAARAPGSRTGNDGAATPHH